MAPKVNLLRPSAVGYRVNCLGGSRWTWLDCDYIPDGEFCGGKDYRCHYLLQDGNYMIPKPYTDKCTKYHEYINAYYTKCDKCLHGERESVNMDINTHHDHTQEQYESELERFEYFTRPAKDDGRLK